MGFKLGYNGKLNYSTTLFDGGGSPTFTAAAKARNVQVDFERAESDLSHRGMGGFRATVTTLGGITISGDMIWDPDDAGCQAFKDAWMANTPIALQALDGTAGEGPQGDFVITSFGRTENLEEGMVVPFTAKTTYSSVAPSWESGA